MSITNPLMIEMAAVSSLKADPKNPRIHDKKQVAQIAQSIEQFGFNVPLLVNKQNQIIAGHGRQLAAQKLGLAEVPIIRLEHLTAAEANAYMIADNRLTENASWDKALLTDLFAELDALDLNFSLDVTGFEMAEIDLMLNVNAGNDLTDEEDPLPDDDSPIVTKPGDLWLLDQHRVYCGNSLETASFEILMQGQKASMVFIDPPYNVPIDGHVCGLGKHKHQDFAMGCGEFTSQEFTEFLAKATSLLALNSTDGSIHYVCMDWRHMLEVLNAGAITYSELKNICVWSKNNAGMGAFYRSQHEMILVYKNGTASHINNFELGQHGRYRTNVWEYPGATSFATSGEDGNPLAMHPTVKPVAMVADAIMDCSMRQDIVLDSFLGSGTTLLAAEKTGRIGYGIEIDPCYVDTAIKRWQKLTGKPAIHAQTGLSWEQTAQNNEVCHEEA